MLNNNIKLQLAFVKQSLIYLFENDILLKAVLKINCSECTFVFRYSLYSTTSLIQFNKLFVFATAKEAALIIQLIYGLMKCKAINVLLQTVRFPCRLCYSLKKYLLLLLFVIVQMHVMNSTKNK